MKGDIRKVFIVFRKGEGQFGNEIFEVNKKKNIQKRYADIRHISDTNEGIIIWYNDGHTLKLQRSTIAEVELWEF